MGSKIFKTDPLVGVESESEEVASVDFHDLTAAHNAALSGATAVEVLLPKALLDNDFTHLRTLRELSYPAVVIAKIESDESPILSNLLERLALVGISRISLKGRTIEEANERLLEMQTVNRLRNLGLQIFGSC